MQLLQLDLVRVPVAVVSTVGVATLALLGVRQYRREQAVGQADPEYQAVHLSHRAHYCLFVADYALALLGIILILVGA
jgi:hypothetical protein